MDCLNISFDNITKTYQPVPKYVIHLVLKELKVELQVNKSVTFFVPSLPQEVKMQNPQFVCPVHT